MKDEKTEVKTITLFRPVGLKEMELIASDGYDWFPDRLPEQPFFYPVCNEEYASKIAGEWNTKDGKPGFVLRFQVKTDFINKYDIHTVGSKIHQEYWIPAEDLEDFNEALVGFINVVRVFDGKPQEKAVDSPGS